MKKTILTILICGVMIIGMTGCGNEKDKTNSNNDAKDNENQSTSSEEIKDNSKNDVIKKTYSCSNAFDDDDGFYLYYENDELVKVTYTSIYADNDDYKEAQEDVKDCKGTTVSRKNGKLYIDFDLKNGALSCLLTDGFIDYSNTSFEILNSQFQKKGYSCSLTE